jgi:hypothetical protein
MGQVFVSRNCQRWPNSCRRHNSGVRARATRRTDITLWRGRLLALNYDVDAEMPRVSGLLTVAGFLGRKMEVRDVFKWLFETIVDPGNFPCHVRLRTCGKR